MFAREGSSSSYANSSLLVVSDVNDVFIDAANCRRATSVSTESLLKSSCGDLMKELNGDPLHPSGAAARYACV